MPKPIAKTAVRCPYCGYEQKESPAARSTFCRQCSEHYVIGVALAAPAPAARVTPAPVPAARRPPGAEGSLFDAPDPAPRAAAPDPGDQPAAAAPSLPTESAAAFADGPSSTLPAPLPRSATPSSAADGEAEAGGWRDRLGKMFQSAPKTQFARCFECNGVHEVNAVAQSTTCRDCGAYIDLQSYKINGSLSRNIATRGTIYVGPKGDLSSSKIVCSSAVILGRMRGNLICTGKVILRSQARFPGTIEAGCLVVEKGAEVDFYRPVRVSSLEVSGKVRGPVICDGHVHVHPTGVLSGAAQAKGFTVDKGGCFEGELSITPRVPPGSTAPTQPANPEGALIEPTRRVWAQSSELIGPHPAR